MPLIQKPIPASVSFDNQLMCQWWKPFYDIYDTNSQMIYLQYRWPDDIYDTDNQTTFMISKTRWHLWYLKPDDIYDT